MNEKLTKQLNSVSVPIIISHQNGVPFISMRKRIILSDKNKETIKAILSCAFHDYPCIVYPHFSDKIHAIGALCNSGIIYKNKEKNQYIYNI